MFGFTFLRLFIFFFFSIIIGLALSERMDKYVRYRSCLASNRADCTRSCETTTILRLNDTRSRRRGDISGRRCSSCFSSCEGEDVLDRAIAKASIFLDSDKKQRGDEKEDAGHDHFAKLLLSDENGDLQSCCSEVPSTSYCKAEKFSTQYIDDSLLKALESMPSIKQVVLFGCNLDTRPYRLDIPGGTILFDVSPEDIHQYKKSKLKRAKVRPGCLHVEVPVSPSSTSEDLEKLLVRRGYQGSRLSLWILDSMWCGDKKQQFEEVMLHVSNCMAYESILVGSVVGSSDSTIDGDSIKDILAGCSLRGDCFPLKEFAQLHQGEEVASSSAVDDGWLFFAKQVGRSDQEKDIYYHWSKIGEEIDEDYSDFTFK